jgi:hypothetical protein
MNWEALLLGLEPVTALAVGVGAVILAPVVNAVGSAIGDKNLNESLSESARELTKKGIVLSFEALENAQATYAQAEEAFRDLVADAKLEHHINKQNQQNSEAVKPQEVEIVSQ